ncbi:uncharacterized protein PAC_14221 [Phialocephala subalpina]|uniref:Uncharacterized protein n=1 Tax=Phialocephala subalpina TaxID=576137 RepID=A0A1L7XGZ9_9HELO|nr:uncharacterized protein PAC_14221 [Phialocephala subalpina]
MPGFDLMHIVLGEPKVLGCIGDFVGVIEVVRDELPPMSKIEEICQKIKDITFLAEGTEPATYSDYGDDDAVAGSSDDSDDDSQPTNDQLAQALGILYEHLQAWIGGDYLPVFKDIDDLPHGLLRDVVPYLKRRIQMIMGEPDIRCSEHRRDLTRSTLGKGWRFWFESSNAAPNLDEDMIRFFTSNKIAAREEYVEYSKEGEITWKKDSLDDQKILKLGILINIWPEYLNDSETLHKEGRLAFASGKATATFTISTLSSKQN